MKKILVFFVSVILFSCSSSVEEEQREWDGKKAVVDKYASQYPIFADMIYSNYERAALEMENSKGISDEETRIEAMERINRKATAGPIITIQKFDRALSNLKSTLNDVERKFRDYEYTRTTEMMMIDGRMAITNAENMMMMPFDNADMALQMYKKQTERLYRLEDNIDDHYDNVMARRRDDEDHYDEHDDHQTGTATIHDSKSGGTTTSSSNTATNSNSKTTTTTTSKKSSMIKCSKCGTKNLSHARKCKKCGSKLSSK